MGLAKHYRFQVQNQTGETVTTSDLEVIRKKIASGAYSYEAATAELLGAGGDSIAAGGFGSGVAQNNDADGWLGLDARFVVNIGAGTPNGNVTLRYQVSEDGTDWPANGEGHVVAIINFTATGTKAAQVTI